MKKTTLAKANSVFRDKKYAEALDLYEELLQKTLASMPDAKVLINLLQNNIESCLKNDPQASSKKHEQQLFFKNEENENNEISSRKSHQYILLVNPSHAHPTEIEFWSSFSERMQNNGYKVVDFAFRKAEAFPNSQMVLHPARLNDLSRRLEAYSDLPMPAWADDSLIDLTVDWEHRRWQLEKYTAEVRSGCTRLIKYVDHVITTLKPAAILTTNKIDPPNNFCFIAAKHYGIPYSFLERSPLNTYLLENSGMFTESDTVEQVINNLVTQPHIARDTSTSQRLIQEIIGNPYGFRATEASKISFDGSNTNKSPLFFLPLDNALWTGWAQEEHPQGDVDYPTFRTPEIAINHLAQAIEKIGGQLVIKPHPSCREWHRIANSTKGVEFCEADLDQLSSEADVIVTFLTKVSYLGLAKGKPVVSFGGGLLDHLGVTYQVKSKIELEEKLRQALAKKGLQEKLTRFSALLPVLAKSFIDDGRTAAAKISQVINITAPLSSSELKHLSELAFKHPNNKKHISKTEIHLETELPIVVFDISRLLSNKLRHSGISRYIQAMVGGLAADARIKTFFAYESQKNDFGMSAHYFNSLQSELNVKLFPRQELLASLDASKKTYLYHSPALPLPSHEKHPKMLRVITIHDIFHLTRPEFYAKGKYITGDIVNSIDLKKDGVIFDSEFSRQDFIEYTGDSMTDSVVVHLAVDRSFSYLGAGTTLGALEKIPYDAQILTIPCQGDPRKGFSRMIKIGLDWINSGENRYLASFGKSIHRYLFDELTANSEKTIYLSNINDQQLAALYFRSSVQLYLSEAEGFGLPPLEAMSCGCPSIMLKNTSLAEIYKGWPFLLDNDTPDAKIVHEINLAATTEQKIRASKFSKKYTWEKTIESTISFYLSHNNRHKQ